jgi:hypothetical protein
MRMLFIPVAALAVTIIAGYGYLFSAQPTVGGPAIVASTLSPYEIHLNYQYMKDLPVHEIPPPAFECWRKLAS